LGVPASLWGHHRELVRNIYLRQVSEKIAPVIFASVMDAS